MSAPSTERPVTRSDAPRANLVGAVRSEWTKLWSVRSTGWTLLALIVVTVGFGLLICFGTNHNYGNASDTERATLDPTALSLAGLAFGQLAIAVLGVLVVTSEYSSGGIRTSLTAVPKRLRLLTAKVLVFAVSALVVGEITCLAAFLAGQTLFAKRGIGASLSDPTVLRAVLGGGLYVAASGLFGVAVGVLLRHTAGAVTTAIALLLVVPIVVLAIPGSIGDTVQRYFTSNAGSEITKTVFNGDSNYLTPWMGFGVFLVWVAVPLGLGALRLQTRDA